MYTNKEDFGQPLPGLNMELLFGLKLQHLNIENMHAGVTTECGNNLLPGEVEDIYLEERPTTATEVLPITASYEEIAACMEVIDQDGFVKKEVIEPGVGKKIQPNTVVLVHYEMYYEGNTTPFDSSIRRKKPWRFRVGCSSFIEGLDVALLSMKTQEVSRFLIGWQCAYMENGCPPRIPPKADILVQIELLRILDTVVPEVMGELTEGESSFSTTLKECKSLLQLGKDFFIAKKFKDAVLKMSAGIKLLGHARVQSEEEQEEIENMMVRLNVNLAAIHNYCNRPEQACVNCNEALRLDPSNVNALFNFGRALIRLNEFGRAAEVLKKGLRLNPKAEKFTEELKRLEKKQKELEVRKINFEVTEAKPPTNTSVVVN